jgi:lipase maturation factor 1
MTYFGAVKTPLIIFDGNCGFCRFWIDRWKKRVGDKAVFTSSQDLGRVPDGVSKDDFTSTVILIEPDGKILRGAKAVFRICSLDSGRKCLLILYERLPGFALISELAYRVVSANRPFFSKLTKLFFK